MITLANRGNLLGQMNPFIAPSAMNTLMPEPTSAAPGGGVEKAALVGASLLGAAIAGTSTLFTYGIARESQSKMVRTTGYIMAAIGAIGTLGYLIGGPALAALSGGRR